MNTDSSPTHATTTAAPRANKPTTTYQWGLGTACLLVAAALWLRSEEARILKAAADESTERWDFAEPIQPLPTHVARRAQGGTRRSPV